MSKDNENEPQEVLDGHVAKVHSLPTITLAGALAIAIAAACVIVAIAYALYYNSPNRKYDIVRGGEESKNQALNVEDEEADTTSPVDGPTAKRKIDYLEKEVNGLKGFSTFDADDLSDQNIRLAPADQPSL